jgi:cofilin
LEFQNKLEVTNKINPECHKVFEEMKLRRKHRYLIFKLGADEIEGPIFVYLLYRLISSTFFLFIVDLVGARSDTYDQFKKRLPYSDCRYAIYDQDYRTADGRPASKLWFISWFPNSATTHVKMAYTSAKGKLRETILGVFDTQAASVEELDNNLGLNENADDDNDGDFDF